MLIVGDKKSLKLGLAENLNKDDFTVLDVMNSMESLLNLSGNKPDVALITLNSPSIDSWEACYFLRGKMDVPVIFLGKRQSEEIWSRVVSAGAEHYIEEPVSMSVLKARLKAVLRRYYRNG